MSEITYHYLYNLLNYYFYSERWIPREMCGRALVKVIFTSVILFKKTVTRFDFIPYRVGLYRHLWNGHEKHPEIIKTTG